MCVFVLIIIIAVVCVSMKYACAVGQGWTGGVQDTPADWNDSGEKSTYQTGTCQPSRFCTTQRNVSIDQNAAVRLSTHSHILPNVFIGSVRVFRHMSAEMATVTISSRTKMVSEI